MMKRKKRTPEERAAERAEVEASIQRLRDYVARERAKLEASGGITLANVRAVAKTGVDWISVGALTHSAPALDLALDFT